MSSSSSSGRTDAAWTPGGSTHNGDVLMTSEHKEILRKHRKELAENLYPEDILTNLQAIKILTPRDVSRIKEKNSEVDMSECLLDTLMRKPDRAFGEFILSLRESDQNHVANVIDKNKVFSPDNHKRKQEKPKQDHVSESGDDGEGAATVHQRRKRKVGELGVRGHVRQLEFEDEEVDDLEEDTVQQQAAKLARRDRYYQKQEEATTQRINLELLETMEEEVKNLKKVVKSGVSQTTISQRKVILETIREIRKFHREINGIESGSVVFRIICPTLQALNDLHDLCMSGRLRSLLYKDFVTPERLKQNNLRDIVIGVDFNQDEYEQCKQELMAKGQNMAEVDSWREGNGEDTEEDEEGSAVHTEYHPHSPPELRWNRSPHTKDIEDRMLCKRKDATITDAGNLIRPRSSSVSCAETSSHDIENISPYNLKWLASPPLKGQFPLPRQNYYPDLSPDGASDLCLLRRISLTSPPHKPAVLSDCSPENNITTAAKEKTTLPFFATSIPGNKGPVFNQGLKKDNSGIWGMRGHALGAESRVSESRGRSTVRKTVKRVHRRLGHRTEALNLSPRRDLRFRPQRSSSPLSTKVALLHLSPQRLKCSQ